MCSIDQPRCIPSHSHGSIQCHCSTDSNNVTCIVAQRKFDKLCSAERRYNNMRSRSMCRNPFLIEVHSLRFGVGIFALTRKNHSPITILYPTGDGGSEACERYGLHFSEVPGHEGRDNRQSIAVCGRSRRGARQLE